MHDPVQKTKFDVFTELLEGLVAALAEDNESVVEALPRPVTAAAADILR